jgi:hypothetical protein
MYLKCRCVRYEPDTDKPRPVNKVIGRAMYRRR